MSGLGSSQCAGRPTRGDVASCDDDPAPPPLASRPRGNEGGTMIDPADVLRVREKFLEGEEPRGLALLPETVVKSWHRSKMAGVDATAVLTGVEVEERPATTLLRAARPVMD